MSVSVYFGSRLMCPCSGSVTCTLGTLPLRSQERGIPASSRIVTSKSVNRTRTPVNDSPEGSEIVALRAVREDAPAPPCPRPPPAIVPNAIRVWSVGPSWRARPFLTGTLGLTRYGTSADSEVRFSAGAGGGVKLFPWSRLGVRLDGRVFAAILDAEGTALACGSGTCFLALHVNAAWQAEFTAGLLVRLR